MKKNSFDESKLIVLVTTMNANVDDFSLYKKMNLQTDTIIANQCNSNYVFESYVSGSLIKVISTDTKGISRNRNIALKHIKNEDSLLIFSDDDLVFNDGYQKLIVDEFVKHPYADAIKFNIHDLSTTRVISMKRISRFERATRRNMSSSGVCGLVIKESVMRKYNFSFHEFFGAGTDNYCGEDTIFIQEMINRGVNFYRSPIDVAGIYQKESSWFKGYDHKYFNVCGKVLATCYPKLCRLIAIRSAFKFSKNKKCNIGFFNILKDYFIGIKKIKKS